MNNRLAASLAATVSVSALLAPAHAALTISSKPTSNMSCAGGVCTATANKAVLNAADLESMLAGGDVSVSGGSLARDISVEASVGWTSASRLTLDSYRAIAFEKPVSVRGSGALTLITNDGATGGDLSFVKKGHVLFWDLGSSLIVNGNSYTLVSKFPQLTSLVIANPAGHYALARDMKARTKPFGKSPMDVTFTGTLEGLGNTIDRLSLSPFKGWAGMITYIGTGGTVRDLSMTNVTIVANARQYGGLKAIGALAATSAGTLDGVHVAGTLNASNSYEAAFGMVAGGSSGLVTNVSASGTMNIAGTNNAAGGLFGGIFNYEYQPITWSHASVDITNTDYTGGLVGSGDGFILDCYATGNVTGGSTGGLVGSFEGKIDSSFATGTVNGNGGGGGLMGSTNGGESIVSNSYSTGAVTAHGYSGGLIALKTGTFSQIYSTGAVTATGAYTPGGLIGYDNFGTTTAGVWDMDTSGISNGSQAAGNIANDPGITGLTDAALKSGLPAGFDPAIWGQSAGINNGYPYLKANPPPQ